MGAARVAKSIAALAVAVTAGMSGCADGDAANQADASLCDLAGCRDGAVITAQLAVEESALVGATFTLCLNGACSVGALTPQADEFDLNGAILDQPVGVLTEADGGILVDFELEAAPALADGGVGSVTIKDGDTYRVEIVGAGGSTILDATRTATYSIVQPNGPDCAPTCHVATIDLTP